MKHPEATSWSIFAAMISIVTITLNIADQKNFSWFWLIAFCILLSYSVYQMYKFEKD